MGAMPTRVARFVTLTLLLAACAAPDIEPQAGTWTYQDVTLTQNSCKDAPSSTPDGEFELTRLSATRFTIDADALENALDCSRDGDTFTCDETLLAKFAVSGMDAELLVTVEVTGTLTSSQRITADETIRQSCAGADCAAVIADQALTLPCEYSFSFTGAAS